MAQIRVTAEAFVDANNQVRDEIKSHSNWNVFNDYKKEHLNDVTTDAIEKINVIPTDVQIIDISPDRIYERRGSVLGSAEEISNQQDIAARGATQGFPVAGQLNRMNYALTAEREEWNQRNPRIAGFIWNGGGTNRAQFGWNFYPTNIILRKRPILFRYLVGFLIPISAYEKDTKIDPGNYHATVKLIVPREVNRIVLTSHRYAGTVDNSLFKYLWLGLNFWDYFLEVGHAERDVVTLPACRPTEAIDIKAEWLNAKKLKTQEKIDTLKSRNASLELARAQFEEDIEAIQGKSWALAEEASKLHEEITSYSLTIMKLRDSIPQLIKAGVKMDEITKSIEYFEKLTNGLIDNYEANKRASKALEAESGKTQEALNAALAEIEANNIKIQTIICTEPVIECQTSTEISARNPASSPTEHHNGDGSQNFNSFFKPHPNLHQTTTRTTTTLQSSPPSPYTHGLQRWMK